MQQNCCKATGSEKVHLPLKPAKLKELKNYAGPKEVVKVAQADADLKQIKMNCNNLNQMRRLGEIPT